MITALSNLGVMSAAQTHSRVDRRYGDQPAITARNGARDFGRGTMLVIALLGVGVKQEKTEKEYKKVYNLPAHLALYPVFMLSYA